MPRVAMDDMVRLNDNGLRQIYGTTVGLAHMKTLEMKVTWVDSKSLTAPEKTHQVEVDSQDINNFLIDDRCFDVVRKGK
jgi:hypothetical protein